MNSDRILVLGSPSAGFRSALLHKLPNLEEFSAVVLHADSIPPTPFPQGTLKNVAQLIGWVKRGHMLSVFGTPNANHAGLEPFKDIEFDWINGQWIEYCGPTSLNASLSPFAKLFDYSAVMRSKVITPLFRVSRGSQDADDQIVAGFRKLGAGTVVLMPRLSAPANQHEQILRTLVGIDTSVATTAFDTPEWVRQFQTDRELDASNTISDAKTAISRHQVEITTNEKIIGQELQLKGLFSATGDVFANTVADAFRELGLINVHGPRRRADIIASDGKRLAAIEAKGLEGTSKEADLRQIQQWIAEVLLTLSSTTEEIAADSVLRAYRQSLDELEKLCGVKFPAGECKGVMIIGTYRSTPLDERRESFPDALVHTIKRAGVCAMTGLQLFEILLRMRKNAIDKSAVVNLIYETNGLLQLDGQWSDVLTRKGK